MTRNEEATPSRLLGSEEEEKEGREREGERKESKGVKG
jgi:hypothetical protein